MGFSFSIAQQFKNEKVTDGQKTAYQKLRREEKQEWKPSGPPFSFHHSPQREKLQDNISKFHFAISKAAGKKLKFFLRRRGHANRAEKREGRKNDAGTILLLTLGLGIAAGGTVALMLPRQSGVRREAQKAADAVEQTITDAVQKLKP